MDGSPVVRRLPQRRASIAGMGLPIGAYTLLFDIDIDTGTNEMRARSLIEGSLYEPETLVVLFRAFDEAWAEIDRHFHDGATTEQARLRLAHAVLVAVDQRSLDADRLKVDALAIMAIAYRDRDWARAIAASTSPG